VVGLDFSKEMLLLAREKGHENHLDVTFREGDALQLPFEDHEFDVASIAFGIRNVDDPLQGLGEMARVVRPGGRVAVLEFGRPGPLMRMPYAAYSRFVLPWVGGRMTGDRGAYRYLRDTSTRFPSGKDFVALMGRLGRFSKVEERRLSGGIVHAYIGTVSEPKRSRTRAR
jgi:demethylmenaquinone methyltransferase/2-methoxy-6-polyprenyl-1,4-benzoquinol methylase